MSNINLIQNKIMELEGGEFQKLFDEYLYKRNGFTNIQTLGVQTGTNKPTKGTPDSYVLTPEGKYILINYGSVASQSVKKIKSDILSCFNFSKLSIDRNKIEKIKQKNKIEKEGRKEFYGFKTQYRIRYRIICKKEYSS